MSYIPSQHKNYSMTESDIDDRITGLERNKANASTMTNLGNMLAIANENVVALLTRVPDCTETSNGTYVLVCAVSGASSANKTRTYSWQSLAALTSVEPAEEVTPAEGDGEGGGGGE